MNEMLMQQIINGVVVGGMYTLIAMGLSQIFGILGISHFAHGGVIILAGYLGYTFTRVLEWPFVPSVIMSIACCIGVGLCMERFAYRPMMNKPQINIFIIALGMLFIVENVSETIWGPDPLAIQADTNVPISIGPVALTSFRFAIVIINFAILGGFWAIMKFTKLGRSVRAMAQNREAAEMVGVNLNHTSALVFGIGSGLAGLCGIFYASMIQVIPSSGGTLVLKGFAVMILGGLGNIPGTIVGGLIMGLVEALGATYISVNFKDSYGFLVLILAMLFRPDGLLTRKIQAKY
jgi:branched-chain amino acid transport system permease protein